ncbi:hypothetical protein EON62_05150, partial [archaeon]
MASLMVRARIHVRVPPRARPRVLMVQDLCTVLAAMEGMSDEVSGADAYSTSHAPGTSLTPAQIREIFDFYCNYGRSAVMTYQDSLDSFMFSKFARECPDLMDKYLNRTEVDLIFMKAKPKFERRLQFSHFLDALAAMAEAKYPDCAATDALRQLLTNNLVPHYELVQQELSKTGESEVPLTGVFKKLHDPRSYTGVYAERFRSGDGRINSETDNRPGRDFRGNTNTGTDENIRDISCLMRPNLSSGGSLMSPSRKASSNRLRSASPSGRNLTSPSSASLASPSFSAASYAALGRSPSMRMRSASRSDILSRQPSNYSMAVPVDIPAAPVSASGGAPAAPRAAALPLTPASCSGGAPAAAGSTGGSKAATASVDVNAEALLAALEKARSGNNTDLLALTSALAEQVKLL